MFERDYPIVLCATEGDATREEVLLGLLRSEQADGALVDGQGRRRARAS